jgi:hypothetical protein
MSKTWQLGALMRKNLILMKRSCFATCCEFLFPIILMILLVVIRRAVKVETWIQPVDDVEFMNTNSTAIVDLTEYQRIVENYKNGGQSDLSWNGLQLSRP